MTVTEYMRALEALRVEHGNIDVETDGVFGRSLAPPPKVAWRRILKSRERREDFWWDEREPERRGEKVIRV